MKELWNLTPHDLTIVFETHDGPISQSWPTMGVARVSEESESLPFLKLTWPNALSRPRRSSFDEPSSATFGAVFKRYGKIEGLPEPRPDRIYVVSLVVLQALNGARPDVYSPDSGPGSAVRDSHGKIVGVKQLMQLAPTPDPSSVSIERARDVAMEANERLRAFVLATAPLIRLLRHGDQGRNEKQFNHFEGVVEGIQSNRVV